MSTNFKAAANAVLNGVVASNPGVPGVVAMTSAGMIDAVGWL